MNKIKINDGERFGKLRILKEINPRVFPNGYRARRFICICDCGKQTEQTLGHLRSGAVISCGCVSAEKARNRMTKHGMRYTRIYKIWCGMKDRCSNEKHHGYKWYKKKGIKVCKKWLIFNNFKNDMLESYNKHVDNYGEKNTTLDRIESDKNYCMSNCRWATWKIQGNNH